MSAWGGVVGVVLCLELGRPQHSWEDNTLGEERCSQEESEHHLWGPGKDEAPRVCVGDPSGELGL